MSKNTNLSFLTDYITADITNGRIGINNASPTVAFDVSGATKISGALTLTSTISNGTYTYTLPSATGTLALTSALSGTTNYVPKFTASGTIGNSSIFDNGTSVGINTASPSASYRLDVSGNVRFTTTNSSEIRFLNYGGSSSKIQGSSGTLAIDAANAVTFETGSTERMRIDSAGNVGIGTTVPEGLVTIKGTSAQPPTSGTTANSLLQLVGSLGAELNIGSNTVAGGYGSYIQASDNNLAVPYPLNLQPNGGNVGIGTSSPAAIVHALKSNATAPTSGTTPSGYALSVGTENGNNGGLWFSADFGGDQGISGIAGSRVSGYETDLRFYTNNTNSARAFSERMRITSGGLFKFQNDGSSLESSTTGVNEFNTNANDTNVLFRNTATSLTNPRAGIDVFYRNAAPNSTSAAFYQGADFAGGTRTLRFEVRSNGGIANYAANDVNLSDIRTKKDIVPLGSYWNKFKAIEIVKFKYKDQSHDDYNIGVISQQVESVAPEFVDTDGFGTTPEDGIPLKSIYTADLYHATIKVLQEAMIKIEELSAKVSLLENK